jgi:hypothetical protein
MTQMRQEKSWWSKDESDEDPTKGYPYYWNRSQNFARFKMPDGILPLFFKEKTF